MKIKQLLLAAAAMVFAVACNETPDPVEPTPEPAGDVWVIAGSHQNWAPADAEALTLADGYYAVKGWEVEANTEFKFVKNKTWDDTDLGYNGEKPILANYFYATVAEGDGKNIKIETAGTYDVYLSEDATKFYVMEAGKAPADAADAETIVVETPCAATGSISEIQWVSGSWGGYMVFDITTANATAAAYLIIASEYVDETYTAEYILDSEKNGTIALTEDWGLNQENFELEYSRCNPETEYTIFLAYQDEAGVTGMVSTTFTTPKEAIAYEDYEAKSAEAWIDDLYDEADVTIYGEKFIAKVGFNCANVETDMEYSMLDPEYPTDVYISFATLMDAEGEMISRLTSATFSCIKDYWSGEYYTCISGAGVNGDGDPVTVYIGYAGVPSGMSVTIAEAEIVEFVVAEATAKLSEDYPNDPSVWYLELTSTAGDMVGLTIDQIYDDCPFVTSGAYQVMSMIDGENPCIDQICSWSYYGGFAVSEEDGFQIQTIYDGETADTNMYIFSGQLSCMNMISGAVTHKIQFATGGMLALQYPNAGGNEGGEEVVPNYPTLTEALAINWDGTHYFSYGVVDKIDDVNVCQLSFGSMSGGGMMGSATLEDCLVLGIYLETSADGIPAGTYEISETAEYGKAVAGKVWDMYEGYAPAPVWGPYMCSCCAYLGSGYQYMDPATLASLQEGGSFTEFTADDCYIAPIVSGTVTVETLGYSEDFGGDLYNVTVDGLDANGTKVTATIKNAPGF